MGRKRERLIWGKKGGRRAKVYKVQVEQGKHGFRAENHEKKPVNRRKAQNWVPKGPFWGCLVPILLTCSKLFGCRARNSGDKKAFFEGINPQNQQKSEFGPAFCVSLYVKLGTKMRFFRHLVPIFATFGLF
ncbi:hypothetical protein [Fibrobacter sp. UWR3]|uniref:hypothetical protein n=1 Tax=Fibrobacter sp. UWR3 TaxID=1896217 RepID=UPI0009355BC3|nr:hypothetical protein [Fibrobacter sp. UWR3]